MDKATSQASFALKPLSQCLDDSNIANHLFALDVSMLDRPGLIVAKWSDRGELQQEIVWSFAELQKKVRQCIRLLVEKGIEPGDRVLLMVRPGLELIALCFALFRMGVVPVVIDPGMGIGKYKKAVAQSRPNALVGIPLSHHVARMFPKSFRSLKKKVLIHPKKFLKQLDLLGDLEEPKVIRTEADELAAVLFTSGSTGAPKGVCYEHGMFGAQLRLLKNNLNINPGEVDLPMLSIFALFNPALGMTTVIPDMNPSRPAKVNPAKIIAAIDRYQVTNSFGSPVLWRKIGDYCETEDRKISTLKRILVAGAAAPTQLYRQYERIHPEGELISPYGATECLPISLITGDEVLTDTAAQTDNGAGICVGKPLDEVSVRIIESSNGSEIVDVAKGAIGEILVTGPSVTKSYDRLPEATSKAKCVIGGQVWHRMGDVGYLDDAGRLWFCGRKVEAIESASGEIVYTEPVEGPYQKHPDVKRCAMTLWDPMNGQGQPQIALVVQPEAASWPTGRAEKEAFAKSLEAHMIHHGNSSPVSVFFFLKTFPVDVRHNAKIHRLTLRKLIQKQQPVYTSTNTQKISES